MIQEISAKLRYEFKSYEFSGSLLCVHTEKQNLSTEGLWKAKKKITIIRESGGF